MIPRSIWIKLTASSLLLLLLFTTVPFSTAEIVATAPLGAIVASGSAKIGKTPAPTGTTVFPGDQVSTEEPTLINFISGSRIELTKAVANFDLREDVFVVQAEQGLFRFHFKEGDNVQFNAGTYRFDTVGSVGHSGEVGLNRNGEIAMNVIEGAFIVLNTANGTQSEVTPDSPFSVTELSGEGSLTRNGTLLTDRSQKLAPDQFKGKCIVVGAEAYPITGNTDTEISINGKWGMKSGSYPYKIVECTEEALIQAGASEESSKRAIVTSVFGVPPANPASHAARNAAIIAGVSGAIGLPLAINFLKGDEPSPTR